MEEENKMQFLKIAMNLCGIATDERTCDLIISIIERLEKLGGDFSVHDAVALQCQNETKYAPQSRAEIAKTIEDTQS